MLARDLHDGAQHRLVALGLELGGIAEHAAASGDDALVARAAQARRHLLEATAELREMARGLHPAVLTQDGLAPAVAGLADAAAVPVRLSLALERRLPAEVEAAAYFVVAEALTNAARYSGADEARVTLMLEDGVLDVEVADDGAGGALLTATGGLAGLADRLAALDARLVVDSPSGSGRRSGRGSGVGETVRVMLADDAVLFREGLARVLTDNGFDVAGQTEDGHALLALVQADPPDVVVLDLRMPPTFEAEGIETAEAIRAVAPSVGCCCPSTSRRTTRYG